MDPQFPLDIYGLEYYLSITDDSFVDDSFFIAYMYACALSFVGAFLIDRLLFLFDHVLEVRLSKKTYFPGLVAAFVIFLVCVAFITPFCINYYSKYKEGRQIVSQWAEERYGITIQPESISLHSIYNARFDGHDSVATFEDGSKVYKMDCDHQKDLCFINDSKTGDELPVIFQADQVSNN